MTAPAPVAPLTYDEVARMTQGLYAPDEEVRPGLTVPEIQRRIGPVDPGPGALLQADVPVVMRGERQLQMHVFGRRDRTEAVPGVLLLHGGGWQTGDHHLFGYMATRVAALGWVAVSATYRLSAEATWPAQLEDVRAALTWMREHAAELGLDAGRIAVWGASAGAHLAAMVGMAPGVPAGPPCDPPDALVLYYPPCELGELLDVPLTGATIAALMGDVTAERLAEASPLTHVSAASPPTFSIAGDNDPITPHRQLLDLHARLTRDGVENELHVLAGRTHGFDFLPDDWQVAWDLAVAYLARRFAR